MVTIQNTYKREDKMELKIVGHCDSSNQINNNNSGNRNSHRLDGINVSKCTINSDFFNFIIILFAIFMIINVQCSYAFIELHTEKEIKNGEYFYLIFSFLFSFQ